MMKGGINPLIIRVIINNLNQNHHHKDDESTLDETIVREERLLEPILPQNMLIISI